MSIVNHQQTWSLWTGCQVDQKYAQQIQKCTAFIVDNKSRYESVGDLLGIPFYIVGCIHYREASFNFETILANGDPLFDSDGNPIRTTHVPIGIGPFDSWEDAAKESILIRFPHVTTMHWDVVNAIENLCSWNGWGSLIYHDINVPYVWSATNQYSQGKYESDGKWNPELIDEQVGCASILLSLRSLGYSLNEIQPQEVA